MFAILLEFSSQKSQAPSHMEGHNAWLQKGFDDGVFLMSGSLQPGRGGVVLAAGEALEAVQHRVAQDPFVEHDVVKATVLEFSPSKADPRLQFLVD
ncbi:MAG: YciI family protein [Nannocystales bacterium]